MPSTQEQTINGIGAIGAMSAYEINPGPYCTRGIYTGESRQNYRERLQQMRSRDGFPRLARRETPITSRRTASMTFQTMQMPAEYPSIPPKARPQSSPARQVFLSQEALINEDVLLDRKANEKTERETLRQDISSSGRRSPLRNTWNSDQLSEVNEILRQLGVSDEKEEACLKPT
ncbi:hypothetical protein GGR55DRAFT_681576 [Xylaria sp. FL0064]|nr:hypothetical protein GGR55DRAFT_681576 [Xylaria sp. FL0064]